MIKKIFNDCFTGKNDSSYDGFRFLIFFGFFIVSYIIIRTNITAVEAATAYSIYFSIGAVSLYIKKDVEPYEKNSNS